MQPAVVAELRTYTRMTKFFPDFIAKKSHVASKFCVWLHALD